MATEPRFQLRPVLELSVGSGEDAYEVAATTLARTRQALRDVGFEVVEWKVRPVRRKLTQQVLPLDEGGA